MEQETIHSHDEAVKTVDFTTITENFSAPVVEEDKIIRVLKEQHETREHQQNTFLTNAYSLSYEQFWKEQAMFFSSHVVYRTVF